ncbi:MAG: oxidoreductase [Actinomycetota bacterium]|nr:oxidoreductase [Actinomycetota bacterium]
MGNFPAVVTTGHDRPAVVADLSEGDLPEGDVTVDVSYSSLNYKDALAVTGRARIARRYPMVCGIDLAGTVTASQHPRWCPGDEVVVTGWGLSETHPGGYTTVQRLRSEWLMEKPSSMSLSQTMAVGTAGLTAALCVLALQKAGLSSGADVAVTGATGGVGSVAVALLSASGYPVTASTGKADSYQYLAALGASEVVDRKELAGGQQTALGPERWAGAVDSVGGPTLANLLARIAYGGAVAACGLAGGTRLPATMLPFILRNVSLLGIDSVRRPSSARAEAWGLIASALPLHNLDDITRIEPMSRLPALAEQMLAGQIRGRVVVDVHA